MNYRSLSLYLILFFHCIQPMEHTLSRALVVRDMSQDTKKNNHYTYDTTNKFNEDLKRIRFDYNNFWNLPTKKDVYFFSTELIVLGNCLNKIEEYGPEYLFRFSAFFLGFAEFIFFLSAKDAAKKNNTISVLEYALNDNKKMFSTIGSLCRLYWNYNLSRFFRILPITLIVGIVFASIVDKK